MYAPAFATAAVTANREFSDAQFSVDIGRSHSISPADGARMCVRFFPLSHYICVDKSAVKFSARITKPNESEASAVFFLRSSRSLFLIC